MAEPVSEQVGDARLASASVARNTGPLTAVFRALLPLNATVLEIASGTGEHAAAFVKARPDLSWTPSDVSAEARASIAAWTAHDALQDNIAPPVMIDASADDWGLADQQFEALVAVNMVHIAPWAAVLGLLAGAERHLTAAGTLVLYGPFMRAGVHNAPSNAEFDAALRAENPDWGVRDLDDLEVAAKERGLGLADITPMPANNFVVVFARRA